MRNLNRMVMIATLAAALSATGCRASLLGQSIWIRPAISFPSRAIDVGDSDRVVMPEYDPRGDSLFVVVRVFPEKKDSSKKFSGSNIREWPEMIRDKISDTPDESVTTWNGASSTPTEKAAQQE